MVDPKSGKESTSLEAACKKPLAMSIRGIQGGRGKRAKRVKEIKGRLREDAHERRR